MSIREKASLLLKMLMTAVSPKLNIRVVYRMKKGTRLNLKSPRSLPEKLVYLRLTNYNHNPLVRELADKYTVRDYVRKKGFGDLLNELYAVYDKPEQIAFDSLPEQFALKLNVGCGCNYFCSDKSRTSEAELREIAHKWMKEKQWLLYAEMQYKGVQKKLLAEKYLEGKDGSVPEDYKVYCFHGKPLAILYMRGRFSEGIQVGFFDTNWQYLGIKKNEKKEYSEFDAAELPERPVSLDIMLDAAERLSEGFPFVRVDFFEVNGMAIFGEMTFSPSGGYDAAEVDINGKSMAEYLNL